MTSTVLIKFDLRDPNLTRIREIANAGREGKIIGFPTETVYGIGAPMSVPNLVARLVQLKGRPENKPFAYHIGDWEMLELLQVRKTAVLRYLSQSFWPGPLTLLTLNLKGEKIGLRFPRHRVTAAIINASGEPFIATSANLSGSPSPRTAQEVIDQLGDKIDYLVDGGKAELGEESTVVDLTTSIPTVVRRGADAARIEEAVRKIAAGKFPRKKIIFVCTGNSCRSPMAEGWLVEEFRRKGMAEEFEVSSCGIGARHGASATPEAILVMKNMEIDISEHRAAPCTRKEVLEADMILVMSKEHSDFLTGLVPSCAHKIRVLSIPDPIGLTLPVYEEVMKSIERKLQSIWHEIIE